MIKSCKCGKTIFFKEFCSEKCRRASENKSFKNYGIRLNLIVNAPDDIEGVRRAIEIVEFLRDVESINSNFDQVVEISKDDINTREIDLEGTIFKILTQNNENNG